jgi:hypothetical protein
MKTSLLLLLALISSSCAIQTEAQNRTIVNATNSEISDNLDLRLVASVFGDSRNLQDFESRLNDPKLQISNLDLNHDGRVDYLRLIESVQGRTHVIIIQSVLDYNMYQDVATVEIEKNWINNIRIQVVGNSFFYGPNYIYDTVYPNTPLIILADFWMNNYQPYCSIWGWNYYPDNFYPWNIYTVNRYTHNVNICLDNYNYNYYNYVTHRRSSNASNIYNRSRSNNYERQYPDHSFSRRNATVNNRHELDQIRNTRNGSSRNEIGYSQNRNENTRESAAQRNVNQRGNSQNRTETPREAAPQRTTNQRDYSQNRNESPRVSSQQRTEPQRQNSQNRNESPRVSSQQRTEPQRQYSQNRNESPRVSAPQRTEPQRNYSQNSNESPRVSSQQRTEPQRDYSQNRNESPREITQQRTESRGDNSSSRNSNSADNTNASRNGNKRT